MIAAAVWASVWIICGIVSYLIWRGETRNEKGKWTVADRRLAIFFCVFTAPLLFMVSCAALVTKDGSDVEAKW